MGHILHPAARTSVLVGLTGWAVDDVEQTGMQKGRQEGALAVLVRRLTGVRNRGQRKVTRAHVS